MYLPQIRTPANPRRCFAYCSFRTHKRMVCDRQKSPTISSVVTLLTRHLSSAATSKLHDYYSFKPPPSLSPESQNPNNTVTKPKKKKQKPRYRPPSSLNRTGRKPLHSDLLFDFRYSYTESSPIVRPIGLREPKYSPFGPDRLDRQWTGVCAPAVDPKVKSKRMRENRAKEKRRTTKR